MRLTNDFNKTDFLSSKLARTLHHSCSPHLPLSLSFSLHRSYKWHINKNESLLSRISVFPTRHAFTFIIPRQSKIHLLPHPRHSSQTLNILQLPNRKWCSRRAAGVIKPVIRNFLLFVRLSFLSHLCTAIIYARYLLSTHTHTHTLCMSYLKIKHAHSLWHVLDTWPG